MGAIDWIHADAQHFKVDFVLLAGDLFHENRPSRECIYRVIALLREYTLNDKPVQIELLSDPEEGKASGFQWVVRWGCSLSLQIVHTPPR